MKRYTLVSRGPVLDPEVAAGPQHLNTDAAFTLESSQLRVKTHRPESER